MRVIGKPLLYAFSERHSDVKSQIGLWLAEAEDAKWGNPNELKARYASASLVKDRVVFNLKGGNYRIVARVDYIRQLIRVEKIGTHKEYDRWKL